MTQGAQLSLNDRFSPFKILTHPEVLIAARDPAPMRPINLEINPVNICNQSCTWCTYGYLHDRRERLSKELIVGLLDDARELGVQSVTWTGGGEPTVYRDIDEVVEYAAELGFSQGMNTNGTRLSERLRACLVSSFDYVRFSVDAGSDEVYSTTHRVREGDLQKVLDNIATLVRERNDSGSRLDVGFSFLVDRSNVHDLANGARRAKEIGVDYFQVKPIVHYVRSNQQFSEQSDLWEALEEQLAAVRELEEGGFTIYVLGHKFDDIRKQDEHYGRSYDTCRGNELLATVGADGSVDVCCAFKGDPDWSFGNLHDQRFRDIWEGRQRRVVLGRIDVKRCPPLCKAHEINKIVDYVNRFDTHREFP